MSRRVSVRPYGRTAFLLELSDQASVHRAWRRLMGARNGGSPLFAGIDDVVPGARTILVVCDRDRGDPAPLSDHLADWLLSGTDADAGGSADATGREIQIPVVYDGPDLDEVAALTGLSVREVVSRHTRGVWTVGFLGFGPGFAYLSGGDPALAVSRRTEPRPAVPAGAVGLAAGMSAVYPSDMPGGWQLIGRTGVVLFDPTRDPPALLGPGDRVRFRRVGHPTHPRPASDAVADQREGAGRRAAPVTSLAIEVIRAGPRTTVQDHGRIGHGHEGVPRAGAADRVALDVANSLVGNPAGAAGLETTLGGPTLRFPAGGFVAVTGAEAPVTLGDAPVPDFPARVRVPPGATLTVGTARRGVHTYVAVAGGVDVPPVLGSRSTDTLSGLGPGALQVGDLLPLGPAGGEAGTAPPESLRPRPVPTRLPESGELLKVRATVGPRADWLAPGQLDALFTAEMTVSPVSDRIGVRTDGVELAIGHRGELPSEGLVAGAVQVPPSGRPIVLLGNHPTTGGYPVVAVVEDGDLAILAQARPGCRIRLERI
ncbi:MAG TPA: 5-oxoprolinase/urea amidolyase family protein [Acidimicrobiales bacterium]|nr:5-oxoprolinase/urea amidolyase family protein [Acidimicrobiales bacterium]